MNPELRVRDITYPNHALMVVHIYGRKCDVKGLRGIVGTASNIIVVEDLAEAHGVKPHPQTDAACWSFFKNKIIAGEEGGAVWFINPEHAELARQLRNIGFTDDHDFNHIPRGCNYRMSNANAEPILASLDRWRIRVHDGINPVWDRRRIESWYDIYCPSEWKMPPRVCPWVYDFRIKGMTGDKQNRIVKELNASGIAARHAFKPMSKQEEYRECKLVTGQKGMVEPPNSWMLSQEVIYLLISPGVITQRDARRSFEIIQRVVGS